MSNKKTVILRADGDSKIGLGHLFRSSALAEMLKNEYECILATTCTIPAVIKELKKNFDDIIFLKEKYSDLNELKYRNFFGRPLVILDGYQFQTKYQKLLINNHYDILCIDDIHSYKFEADIIVNHAGGLTPLDYQAKPSTQFYLGPQYAVLRSSFVKAAQTQRSKVTDDNCLICFGGADPENRTLQTLKRLKDIQRKFSQVHVVIGSAYVYNDELSDYLSNTKEIILHKSVSPQQMLELMKLCSYAICSPSTVAYEYLSVGGLLFLEMTADNQKDIKNFLIQEGMAFSFGDIDRLSDEQIQKAFIKSSRYFDGKSDERLRRIVMQFFDSKNLSIRKAQPTDVDITYLWANDPEVRVQSYNSEPIQWETHQEWFYNKLQDKNSFYYIFDIDDQQVAQIRFQIDHGKAVLGYLVDKKIRSKGLGTSIIGKGIEAFFKDTHIREVIGYVKKTNIPSQRSFERLAFVRKEADTYLDSYKYIMKYGN